MKRSADNSVVVACPPRPDDGGDGDGIADIISLLAVDVVVAAVVGRRP